MRLKLGTAILQADKPNREKFSSHLKPKSPQKSFQPKPGVQCSPNVNGNFFKLRPIKRTMR